MLAPTELHVYRCRCGRRVVSILSGGDWAAWDVWARLAEEHATACALAREKWEQLAPEAMRVATPPADSGGGREP